MPVATGSCKWHTAAIPEQQPPPRRGTALVLNCAINSSGSWYSAWWRRQQCHGNCAMEKEHGSMGAARAPGPPQLMWLVLAAHYFLMVPARDRHVHVVLPHHNRGRWRYMDCKLNYESSQALSLSLGDITRKKETKMAICFEEIGRGQIVVQ